MKVTRDPIRCVVELQSGGGCVGAVGTAFSLLFAVMGSALVMAWRAGDLSKGALLFIGTFVGTFFLCGLGVATYRERFRFDARGPTITLIRQVLLVTYRWQQWSIRDFEAVELYWYYRRKDNVTRWFHIIRLLPTQVGGAPPEPLELGSGEAGNEMRAIARNIADFCNLPLREPPKNDR